MRLKTLLLILLSVFYLSGLNAQKNDRKFIITGTVLDASKSPVVNAIVMIDGEKTNSVTDASGKYKVKVNSNAVKISIFTFGNGIFEEVIGGRTEINFNFSNLSTNQAVQSENPGDEGINTGYGYVKKKSLTTQVSKIDGTNKKYASYSSIYDMIQREVSGVKVNGKQVIIQASKNLWGEIPAMFVVDGVPVDDISDLAPVTVESIEVLKGTSAAIYGSRGYGGVILIKTRIRND